MFVSPTLLHTTRRLLRRHGREAFVAALPRRASVLDVGCGNDSPYLVKTQRPDVRYVGIDVADFNHASEPSSYADRYVVCEPAAFARTIEEFGSQFDAVISSHNIEHCDDPSRVLAAMAAALVPGGRMFLAWPAEHSVGLPSRRGTLNFYDDPTHRQLPKVDDVVASLGTNGVVPEFIARAYRPPIPFVIGALFEPIARVRKRLVPLRATWALFGFEAVLWLIKR